MPFFGALGAEIYLNGYKKEYFSQNPLAPKLIVIDCATFVTPK